MMAIHIHSPHRLSHSHYNQSWRTEKIREDSEGCHVPHTSRGQSQVILIFQVSNVIPKTACGKLFYSLSPDVAMSAWKSNRAI